MAVNRKDGDFGRTVAVTMEVVGASVASARGGPNGRLLTLVNVADCGGGVVAVDVDAVTVAFMDGGILVAELLAVVSVDPIAEGTVAGVLYVVGESSTVTVFDAVSVVDGGAVSVEVPVTDVVAVVVAVETAGSGAHGEPHRSMCLTRAISASTRELRRGLVWSHSSVVWLLQSTELFESMEDDSFATVASRHTPGAPRT